MPKDNSKTSIMFTNSRCFRKWPMLSIVGKESCSLKFGVNESAVSSGSLCTTAQADPCKPSTSCQFSESRQTSVPHNSVGFWYIVMFFTVLSKGKSILRYLSYFSTLFQFYRGGQCSYPCFPGIFFTSAANNRLSKPLAAFLHNH